MNTFGLATASIVCFLGILLAWPGVDFALGSPPPFDGFGGGGVRFMLAAGVVELALIAWTITKTKTKSVQNP